MGSIEAIEGIIARSRLSSAQMDFRNFWYRQGQSSEWSEAQSLEHACQGRWWLGVPLKRMKQISYGKQRETKNSTPQIEVVTDAMLRTPMHPRKQMECFADMSKNDHRQTSCAE